LMQAGVDDLHTGVPQRPRDDLRSAIVAVKTRLGHHHADRTGHSHHCLHAQLPATAPSGTKRERTLSPASRTRQFRGTDRGGNHTWDTFATRWVRRRLPFRRKSLTGPSRSREPRPVCRVAVPSVARIGGAAIAPRFPTKAHGGQGTAPVVPNG